MHVNFLEECLTHSKRSINVATVLKIKPSNGKTKIFIQGTYQNTQLKAIFKLKFKIYRLIMLKLITWCWVFVS